MTILGVIFAKKYKGNRRSSVWYSTSSDGTVISSQRSKQQGNWRDGNNFFLEMHLGVAEKLSSDSLRPRRTETQVKNTQMMLTRLFYANIASCWTSNLRCIGFCFKKRPKAVQKLYNLNTLSFIEKRLCLNLLGHLLCNLDS